MKLRHADCGGELEKHSLGMYRCARCGQHIDMGGGRKLGADARRIGAGRVERHYYEIGRQPTFQEEVMSLHNLIASGGVVVIVGGHDKSWSEFRQHPQIVFWTGEQKDVIRKLANGDLPANARGVIISRFISHSQLGKVQEIARRRHLTVFPNKNDGEVTRLLEEIMSVPKVETVNAVPPRPAPPVEAPPTKITLVEFVSKHITQEKTTHQDEAKRLLPIVASAGITTTQGSLQKCVAVVRQRLGLSGTIVRRRRAAVRRDAAPKDRAGVGGSLTPSAPAAISAVVVGDDVAALVAIIDDLQAGLTLLREGLSKIKSQGEDHLRLKRQLADLLRS